MSNNSISTVEALFANRVPIPVPAAPVPTGNPLADYNALKVYKATRARIEAHNEALAFGEIIAAEKKAMAEKVEREKRIREEATKCYKTTGADSQLILSVISHAVVELGGAGWLESFLWSGPTLDAPRGHAKGSRAFGSDRTAGKLTFGSRKYSVILKDVTDVPDAEGETEESA